MDAARKTRLWQPRPTTLALCPILIPLAQDGHTLVGMDQAAAMLRRAETKIPANARERVTLR